MTVDWILGFQFLVGIVFVTSVSRLLMMTYHVKHDAAVMSRCR